MGVQKTSDHIQINIKTQNPSQEPPASSKAPNEDLKDMDVLCTFKIKIESQNSDHGYIKDQIPYPNQDKDAKTCSGTSNILLATTFRIKIENRNFKHWYIKDKCDHIQIKIKMPNPRQEPPATSKAPNQDFKDMDICCNFKVMITSQTSEHGCKKDK